MASEVASEIPVYYKLALVVIFVYLLNVFFAKCFKDLKVPFIPRIVENRPNIHVGDPVPVRSEFIEEFLTALQNKRNRIITGNFILDVPNRKVRTEKWLNFS